MDDNSEYAALSRDKYQAAGDPKILNLCKRT